MCNNNKVSIKMTNLNGFINKIKISAKLLNVKKRINFQNKLDYMP